MLALWLLLVNPLYKCDQLPGVDNLPAEATPAMLEDDDFLQAFHHALLEVHLEDGALICPETEREFRVSQGIPNLLLQEDEC